MAYLTPDQLKEVGFRKLGNNVLVSDRAAIYNADRIEIGDHCRIDDFSVLSGKITIGRNVHIAVYAHVAGGTEGVTFEDFSAIAYGVHVLSQTDDYGGHALTNPTVPAKYKRETKKAVRIGRHCIVGTQSVIMPGVTLGEGSSVGALSLVTMSTQPWSIYFGAPAKRLRERKQHLLALEEEYLRDEAKE